MMASPFQMQSGFRRLFGVLLPLCPSFGSFVFYRTVILKPLGAFGENTRLTHTRKPIGFRIPCKICSKIVADCLIEVITFYFSNQWFFLYSGQFRENFKVRFKEIQVPDRRSVFSNTSMKESKIMISIISFDQMIGSMMK